MSDLAEAICDLGNPFLEKSARLFSLCNKDLAAEYVIKTVKNIKDIGKAQYDDFASKRLLQQTKSISQPIKKNKLALFRQQSVKQNSRSDEKFGLNEK